MTGPKVPADREGPATSQIGGPPEVAAGDLAA